MKSQQQQTAAADSEVRALVGRLHNLHEIFRVQGEILSYGEETIDPLAELLLCPPSTFPEPRVAAAECLGAIGGDKAVAALIRVLDYYDLRAMGPVQRFAEETVRNAAARRLARFRHARVIDALLSSLKRDHLIGAGEALAALGETAAIPHLIECLEDDVKKYKATEALLSFGQPAVPYLENALSQPRWVEGAEPPLSQERRARVAELLGQLKTGDSLSALKHGLHDGIPRVRVACALSLAGLQAAEASDAIPELITGLEDSDLLVRTNCEESLIKMGTAAIPLLAQGAVGEMLHLPYGEEATLDLRGRTAAIKVLGTIRSTEAVPYLISLLDDPDEMIRFRTVVALRGFANNQVLAPLKRIAGRDLSKTVRTEARAIIEGKVDSEVRSNKLKSAREKTFRLIRIILTDAKQILHQH